MKDNKKLLREKVSRRNALVNAIEDLNIDMLALTGEIRWIDQEIEYLTEGIHLESIRQANEKIREFEKRNPSNERFIEYKAIDISDASEQGWWPDCEDGYDGHETNYPRFKKKPL